jgi:hypothetical protein
MAVSKGEMTDLEREAKAEYGDADAFRLIE